MQKRSLQKWQQNGSSGFNPSFRIEIDSVGIATLWLKKQQKFCGFNNAEWPS
jgi:hypothetical protein